MDIYVGSIPFKLKESELRELFEKYGTVKTVTLIKNKMTGQNKGFAFVNMPDPEQVRKAVFELNGIELMERRIEVSVSEKKDETKKQPKKKVFAKARRDK
jgi:RNA recognition motif-containing protein